MDKDLMKEGLLIAARNKEEILNMLEGIDAEHGDRGVIKITENFLNLSCYDLILKLSQGKVDDYHLAFRGGKIYLDLTAKVFIKAKARLVINIEKMVFEPKKHEILLSYERDGMTMANNFIPKILERLAEANPGKISIEGKHIHIDLDKLLEIPPCLALEYMESDMGTLELAFLIV